MDRLLHRRCVLMGGVPLLLAVLSCAPQPTVPCRLFGILILVDDILLRGADIGVPEPGLELFDLGPVLQGTHSRRFSQAMDTNSATLVTIRLKANAPSVFLDDVEDASPV